MPHPKDDDKLHQFSPTQVTGKLLNTFPPLHVINSEASRRLEAARFTERLEDSWDPADFLCGSHAAQCPDAMQHTNRPQSSCPVPVNPATPESAQESFQGTNRFEDGPNRAEALTPNPYLQGDGTGDSLLPDVPKDSSNGACRRSSSIDSSWKNTEGNMKPIYQRYLPRHADPFYRAWECELDPLYMRRDPDPSYQPWLYGPGRRYPKRNEDPMFDPWQFWSDPDFPNSRRRHSISRDPDSPFDAVNERILPPRRQFSRETSNISNQSFKVGQDQGFRSSRCRKYSCSTPRTCHTCGRDLQLRLDCHVSLDTERPLARDPLTCMPHKLRAGSWDEKCPTDSLTLRHEHVRRWAGTFHSFPVLLLVTLLSMAIACMASGFATGLILAARASRSLSLVAR